MDPHKGKGQVRNRIEALLHQPVLFVVLLEGDPLEPDRHMVPGEPEHLDDLVGISPRTVIQNR